MRRTVLGASCLIIFAAVFTIVLVSPGIAEDPKESVLSRIDQGRAAFAAGNTQAAIDHLQQAIGLMQQMVAKGLENYLPKVPEGWKAGEPDVATGSFGSGEDSMQWTSASRTYTRVADSVRVDVSISSSPQMVQPGMAMLKMYENPQMRQMMNQDPDTKIDLIEKDGWKALSIVKKGDDAEIAAFKGKTMLTLSVSNGSAELLMMFWKAMDLAALGGVQKTPEPDEPDAE